jgi:hypothetical protein
VRRSRRAEILATTLSPPPQQLGVTHWSSRLLAAELGISHSVAAGAHPDGSVQGAAASTPQEVAAFLADYGQQREQPFTGAEQAAAAAAATWVMAYNARCQLHNQTLGHPAGEGSFLQMLPLPRGLPATAAMTNPACSPRRFDAQRRPSDELLLAFAHA